MTALEFASVPEAASLDMCSLIDAIEKKCQEAEDDEEQFEYDSKHKKILRLLHTN
ncbi:hypothetical protein MH117_17540 [Paenibacillus sp. ACRRX]|uniref:hypothetical protein n=1 Tax=unclassified Paenibacillus TaxID=185978 RepID=UPI001EF58F8F|nr:MULTISPECIES: hypothetical protein [unclassified Paenibacillus]MCG7409224.1 hypothetical protein [Paenibacillus sp. ACRRX]MDK8181784.1 hypothetical protein [Paenibacillus sp. UMB4589-SE434]